MAELGHLILSLFLEETRKGLTSWPSPFGFLAHFVESFQNELVEILNDMDIMY